MDVLGVHQVGGATKWAWAKLTKDDVAAARAGRLRMRTLAREASVEGPLRSDETYMESVHVAASGQAGKWAGVHAYVVYVYMCGLLVLGLFWLKPITSPWCHLC